MEEKPQLNNQQVEGLKRLLDVFNPNTLTKEEFVKNFKEVVAFIKRLEKKTNADVMSLKDSLTMMSENAHMGLKGEFEAFKSQILSQVKDLLTSTTARIDAKIAEVDKRIALLKDGKDADEEKIVNDVLSKIVLPEPKVVPQEIPAELTDKIDRLGKQLEATSRTANEANTRVMHGAVGFRGVADFSFGGDGSTTTFTLPKSPALKGKALFIFRDGRAMVRTTDYTLADRVVTTTFTAQSSEIIDGFLFY